MPELQTSDQREIYSAPSMFVTAVTGVLVPAQIVPLLPKYCCYLPKYCRCCAAIFHKRPVQEKNIGVPKNVQTSDCFRFDFLDFCLESCFVTITILYSTHHKITYFNITCRISGCLGKLHDKLYLGPLYVKRTMKLLVKVLTITKYRFHHFRILCRYLLLIQAAFQFQKVFQSKRKQILN